MWKKGCLLKLSLWLNVATLDVMAPFSFFAVKFADETFSKSKSTSVKKKLFSGLQLLFFREILSAENPIKLFTAVIDSVH